MAKFKTKEDFFDFSKLLVVIPIDDLVNLMVRHEVKLPLYVHRFLLKETIRPQVFAEKLYGSFSDEQKFRLRGYDNYSIFKLEKMIHDYNLDFDLAKYKEMMLNLLFVNKEALVIRSFFFNDLEQLKHNYTVDLERMSYDSFMEIFKKMLYEQDGFLDGVSLEDWTEEVLTSYTLGELKELGLKYKVKIPRRINKGKLIEILSAKFKLSVDEKELLETKSVLELEIYAKERGFKISIDSKKTDMIEYLKYSLEMYDQYPKDDFFDYDIPLASDEEAVEEDLVEEVEEIQEEVYIPEEVHDEIDEPVVEKEEPVVPEETIIEDLDEVEEEIPVEEIYEEEPVEEDIEEPVVVEEVKEEKPVEPVKEVKKEEKKAKKEKVEEEVKEEEKDIEIPEALIEEPSLADSSLLSPEEKELLDEKINVIIKKYYKKRRRRRTIWTIVIILILAVGAWAAYTYLWPLIEASL